MQLLLIAAVFVLPPACAYTTAASDPIPTMTLQIPASTLPTAARFYANVTSTADNPAVSTDVACSRGELEIPRLGCWPSSRFRSLNPSQSFGTKPSSGIQSLNVSHHFELTSYPAKSREPSPPMFTYDPTPTQPAEPTAPKIPTGDPNEEAGEQKQVGAILGLWITVAISVAVFLGWLCWEMWRDMKGMIWLERNLDREPLLDHGRLGWEDIEAVDVTRR